MLIKNVKNEYGRHRRLKPDFDALTGEGLIYVSNSNAGLTLKTLKYFCINHGDKGIFQSSLMA